MTGAASSGVDAAGTARGDPFGEGCGEAAGELLITPANCRTSGRLLVATAVSLFCWLAAVASANALKLTVLRAGEDEE
jgi:hypothetical protein